MGNDEVDLKIDEARALESSWDDVPSEPRRSRDTTETEFNFKLPGGINRVIDDVAAELGPTPSPPNPPGLAKLASLAQAPPPSAPPPMSPMLTPAWGMTPPPTSARPVLSAPPPTPIDDSEETPLLEQSPLRATMELPPPRRVHKAPPSAPPMTPPPMTPPAILAPMPSAQSLVADLRSISVKPSQLTPAPGLMKPSVPIVPDRPTMLIDGEAVALDHMVAKAMGQVSTIEVPSMVITGVPVSLLEPGLVIAEPKVVMGTPAASPPTPAELKRVDLSAGLHDLVPSSLPRPASSLPLPSPKPAPPSPRVAPPPVMPLEPSPPAPWWKPFGLGIAVASLLWLIIRLLG